MGRQSIRVIGAFAATEEPDGSLQLSMFTDSLRDTKPRVLSPEQPSTEFHVKESEFLDRVVYLGVNDGFGSTRDLWLVPWYRRPSIRRRMKKRPKPNSGGGRANQ
jgi:hypothetical protein